MIESYGDASGAAQPISLLELMRDGSALCHPPDLAGYIASAGDLEHTAMRLFDRMRQGVVDAVTGQWFALADAADAHRALNARQTVGSTVLIP